MQHLNPLDREGEVPTDKNLDGFLRLFANVFNRLDPCLFIAFDDDYCCLRHAGAGACAAALDIYRFDGFDTVKAFVAGRAPTQII